jgi:V/A-type H+-transporting ATPase subunit A
MEAKISGINANTIHAIGLESASIGNIVQLGDLEVYGEIIAVAGANTIIQAYEETTGLKINDSVKDLKKPLTIELGPGVLSNIFDGLGRRLDLTNNNFIERGFPLISLDKKKKWDFKPTKAEGDTVVSGDIIGEVQETDLIKNKIMVPLGIEGKITKIEEGQFTVNQKVAEITMSDGKLATVTMAQVWPIRKKRPIAFKINHYEPLITGQRVFDAFFPLHKGGSAALPGGFGSGKTLAEQQFAKFSNTDISVYVGCGERGNEMAGVLSTFPSITDPYSNKSIMNKTVLIANTSNMPIIAREASIFTGITIAEFYRDMGYSVLLTADSTSRWAEALRELGSELGEMPVEEGFPASLFASLASFYSRAGMAQVLGSDKRKGSITIVSAISPPGGDFSEPVTQTTMRLVDALWELDTKLSNMRHYPAVNWADSYSLTSSNLSAYYEDKFGKQFSIYSKKLLNLLNSADKIDEIASIVGRDALPDKQAATLRIADIIKLNFLQQNAFDKEDRYTDIKIIYRMMEILAKLIDRVTFLLDSGTKFADFKNNLIWSNLSNLKHAPELDNLEKEVDSLSSKKSVR